MDDPTVSRVHGDVWLRRLELSDATEMTEMVQRNRADIERVGPPYPDDHFTSAGQLRRIEQVLEETRRGSRHCWTIRVGGQLAGDIALSHIQRGPLQRANVGYLVDSGFRGRGVASAALRLAVREGFTRLGLHALEAGAMPSNIASQRVLEAAGFRRVGLAERLLFIARAWEDHVLYEIVGADFVPDTTASAPTGLSPAGA